MHTVTRMSAQEFAGSVEELAVLLADAVDGGASVGFLKPFGPEEAAAWWREQEAAVAEGGMAVWGCRDADGFLAGTVSLVPARKPNSRHRAELVKLLVHRRARGRGLSRLLLAAAEEGAVAAGAGLLVLDTETGSAAEHVYLTGGWTRYGVVPGYAGAPDGTPLDCSFFYKHLTAGA